jgi:uncharacterized protein YbaP (TraB family)
MFDRWPLRRRVPVALICIVALAIAALPLHLQAAQNAAAAKHFLWKVEGRKTPLYLLGSIHAGLPAFYPLAAVIEEAFESADTLVEEVDLDEATDRNAVAVLRAKALYQDGQTLDKALSPETYARLETYLQSAGVPIAPMKRFKPWMVALTVSRLEAQKAGLDPNLAIDKHFFDEAKKAGKKVQGLETLAYQTDMLDGLDAGEMEEMIRRTLTEIDTERKDFKSMIDAWTAGDAAALEALLFKGSKDTPRIHERLEVARNKNWLPALETCLDAPHPCFVVVGAAHLVGPDGLVTMLRKKGLTVEQQ